MKSLKDLTNTDAFEVANILGSHLSDEGKIQEACELFTTNRLFNQQTNIPGIKWYRAFKYLENAGYTIE